MFSIPSNPIMDAIEKLYDISKDAAFSESTYCNNKNEVDLLKDFWDCNEEQAVIMALLVQSHFEDKSVSINELLTYTDSKTSIAPSRKGMSTSGGLDVRLTTPSAGQYDDVHTHV